MCLFICKSESERERVRSFSIHCFTPKAATIALVGPGQNLEARARSPRWVVGLQAPGPSATALPGATAGRWIKSGAAGPQSSAYRDASLTDGRFTHDITPAPGFPHFSGHVLGFPPSYLCEMFI